MVTVRELHYEFKLKFDRIDSLANPDFNALEIDYFLNEAQLLFIKKRMFPSPPKNLGFEGSQKRIDDLANLLVKFPLQPAVVPTEPSSGVYEVDFNQLNYTPLYIVSAWANYTTSNCEKKSPLKYMQHDDYIDALRNPFSSSHEEFIPYNIGIASQANSKALYAYSSFALDTIVVEYIRTPRRVSLGTYAYIDGVTYPEQTIEVSDFAYEIVDIAAQLAANASQDPTYQQLKNFKIEIQE